MRGLARSGLRLLSVRLTVVASVGLFALLANVAGAVDGGALDRTFGSAGAKVIDLGKTEGGFGLAVRPDGNLVLVGTQQSPGENAKAIVDRLAPDGTPDPAFGNGGVVVVPSFGAFSVALQNDGRIVVGGATDVPGLALMRLLPDGRLDTSFGTAGRATADVGGYADTAGLAIQPGGKIVAVGRASPPGSFEPGDFAVARFNANGSLDSSFAGSGRVRTDFGGNEDALDVALQPDGKIVVVGGPGNLRRAMGGRALRPERNPGPVVRRRRQGRDRLRRWSARRFRSNPPARREARRRRLARRARRTSEPGHRPRPLLAGRIVGRELQR
jgi:uncharacterized delta-60 repeat protein